MTWLDEYLTGDSFFDDALTQLSNCPTPGTVKAILHAFQWQRDQALAEKIRHEADGPNLILPEFQEAYWQGMHRAADLVSPGESE